MYRLCVASQGVFTSNLTCTFLDDPHWDDFHEKIQRYAQQQVLKELHSGTKGATDAPWFPADLLGGSFVAPGHRKVFERLLDNEHSAVESFVHKRLRLDDGDSYFTVVIDGWSTLHLNPILNVILVNEHGAYFYCHIDCTGKTKDAEFIGTQINATIARIGRENIVALVTDNEASMTTAWDIVRKEHPHVWCLSCTAHCLHLLFKDIFELEWFKESHEPIHDAVKWIREHPWCKARVERYNKARRNKHRKRGLKLKLPGVTRYGSKYFTLKRAIRMRKDVCRMFNHPNFEKQNFMKKTESKAATLATKATFEKQLIWNRAARTCELVKPLVAGIKLCDHDVAMTSKVYGMMHNFEEHVEGWTGATATVRKAVSELVDERWEFLHEDLHSGTYATDPLNHAEVP